MVRAAKAWLPQPVQTLVPTRRSQTAPLSGPPSDEAAAAQEALERKLESNAAVGVSEVRRIELITGSGRLRRWSRADKVRRGEPGTGVNVSQVARGNV
jgi:hypothetical protein